MTPRLCHCPDGPRLGHTHPYLPPLREGELQRYAGLIPDGSGLTIEERRVPRPPVRRGWENFVELPKGPLDPDYTAEDRTFENETRPQ